MSISGIQTGSIPSDRFRSFQAPSVIADFSLPGLGGISDAGAVGQTSYDENPIQDQRSFQVTLSGAQPSDDPHFAEDWMRPLENFPL